MTMATLQETLTPEQELAAAHADVWLTDHRLGCAAGWIRALAGVPREAPFAFALGQVQPRADKGDRTAMRALAELGEAGAAHEGARVALAELPNHEER